MKINEKTLNLFATSKPVDKEGHLMKRGEGLNIFLWRKIKKEVNEFFI